MFKKKSFLSVIGIIGLLGTALYSLSSKTSQTTAKTIVASKNIVSEISCYPTGKYEQPKEVHKYKYRGIDYFEVLTSSRSVHDESILYFQIERNKCGQIDPGSVAAREYFMPKPAALYFAEIQVDKIYQACLRRRKNEADPKKNCNMDLERIYNRPGSPDQEEQHFILSEVAEVLHKRGIKTNKAIIIKTPLDYQKAFEMDDARLGFLRFCAKSTSSETIGRISLVYLQEYQTLRGTRLYYDVAVEHKNGNKSYYDFQIIHSYDDGSCRLYYAGSIIGNNSIRSHFSSEQEARSAILAWYKWRLKNIPGERQSIQRYLNGSSPRLTAEDHWSLSQLGFKVPRN